MIFMIFLIKGKENHTKCIAKVHFSWYNTVNMSEITQSYSVFAPTNRNKWLRASGYYVHYYKSFDMIFHSHDRIEIMYVIMGEMQVEIQAEDGSTEKYTVSPNSYVFIDSGVPHKITIDNIITKIYNLEFTMIKSKDYEFTFNTLMTKDESVKDFFSRHARVLRVSDDGLFAQNMLLIQKFFGDEIDRHDAYIDYLVSALLMLLSRQSSKIKGRHTGISYINKAVGFIRENFNREVSLTDVARACDVSPNYLNSLFSSEFNMTVMTYVNKYRINRATLLLTSTDLSVDDIRKQIGYNNKASFHQNFIKFIGVPPGRFRRNNSQDNVVQTLFGDQNNTYWNEEKDNKKSAYKQQWTRY